MQAIRTGIARGWFSLPRRRTQSTAGDLINRAAPHLPRIFQPATWEQIVPSSIRARTKDLFAERRQKPTNPATYFIWIYILIGSQAIRILQVKNDHQTFSRRADLQIEKLREVVRKLQAGEEVDVEKALGTGVPEEEEAWEQALREIEDEERLWTDNKLKKRERREQRRLEAEEAERQKQDASPVNQSSDSTKMVEAAGAASSNAPPFKAPGFY